MQSNVVKAFRQRLVRGGFTRISISDCFNGSYYVSFYDKKGNFDRLQLTEDQMNNIPRTVWFD